MSRHLDYGGKRRHFLPPSLVVPLFLLLSLVPSAQGRFFRGDDEPVYLFRGKDSPVTDLDQEGFEIETEKPGRLLVNFYAPWCGHCQHYAPIYMKLASDSATTGVRFMAVSCTANKGVCNSEQILGYPTIKAWNFPGVTNGFAIPPNRRQDAVRDWLLSNLPSAEKSKAASAPKEEEGGEGEEEKGGGGEWAGGEKAKKKTGKELTADVAEFFESNVEALRLPRISDALTSIMFALEKEVFLGVTTLDPHVLQALRSFLRVLSLSFPGSHHRRAFHSLLAEIDDINVLDLKDWDEKVARLIRRPLFSGKAAGHYKWGFCEQPGKNGYTCGLWTLFHILTVKSGTSSATPRVTMEAIHDFVEHFFGCSMCRSHFLAIYDANSFNRLAVADSRNDDNRALVLWLWQFHNGVNVRVAMEATKTEEGAEESDDPFDWDRYHSELWPSVNTCPECWKTSKEEEEARVTDFKEFQEDQYASYIAAAADWVQIYRRVSTAYGIDDQAVDASMTSTVLDSESVLLSGLRDSAAYYAGLGALAVIMLLLAMRYRSIWKLKTLTGRHKKVDTWMSFQNRVNGSSNDHHHDRMSV